MLMAILSQAFERRKVQRLDTTRLKGSTPWRRNSPDYERVAAMPPVAKAIAARKSLGPKRPCGFDSRPGHRNTLSRYLEGVFFITWQTFGKHLYLLFAS